MRSENVSVDNTLDLGRRSGRVGVLAGLGLATLAWVAPAQAAFVDLTLLTGGQLPTDPYSIVANDGTIVTFEALGSGNNLRATDSDLDVVVDLDILGDPIELSLVGPLFQHGICADDDDTLIPIEDCAETLKVSVVRPVDDLVFEQQGVNLLTSTELTIEFADTSTLTLNESDLLALNLDLTVGSLVGANMDGRTFDLTIYSGIVSVTLVPQALVSTGLYYGGFQFAAEGAGANVPLPPAAAGLLAGVAALGAMSRRRRRKAA